MAKIADLEEELAVFQARKSLEAMWKFEDLERKVTGLEVDLKAKKSKVAALEKEVEDQVKAAALAEQSAEKSPGIELEMDMP